MPQELNSVLWDRHETVNSEIRKIANELYCQCTMVPRLLTYRLRFVHPWRRLRVCLLRPARDCARVASTVCRWWRASWAPWHLLASSRLLRWLIVDIAEHSNSVLSDSSWCVYCGNQWMILEHLSPAHMALMRLHLQGRCLGPQCPRMNGTEWEGSRETCQGMCLQRVENDRRGWQLEGWSSLQKETRPDAALNNADLSVASRLWSH